MKLSRVVQFGVKVPKLVENEIVVQLVDSFHNPIMFHQKNLSLQFGTNSSSVLSWTVAAGNNGLYTFHYVTKDIGAFEICVLLNNNHISPCPLQVYVYSSEYFPKAFNDTVSVWEDESVSFDVLENDYFAGVSASIFKPSMPSHGSLLQYGRLFRYTPFKGFFGDDTFFYTILDINNNTASGTVFIAVLITPPKIFRLPVQLQATEDVLSPKFGGFPGIGIEYSDPVENFSLRLSAKSGTVFVSPMWMQFWQPTWNRLSVDREEGDGNRLFLVGCAEVINSVLQSIQYLGNGNFSGDDVIKVSTMNKNGIHDTYIPIFVEPINDPPFIDVPEFVILEKADKDYWRIFNRRKGRFEFLVGDPDFVNFAGNESHFVVSLSMEVNHGILRTNLPAELINTTELKLKNSYQWQPLQAFVTISKHFLVKAKGIRFRGTVEDCNEAMQHLLYQKGGEHGAVLTVMVNDMGHYGCYPDCGENMSASLFTEATVNLVWRKPMSSLLAHTLGLAIIIDFILILFLGAMLLFFICKCALVLGIERRDRNGDKVFVAEKTPELTSGKILAINKTQFSGCCSSRSLLRQRSHHKSGNENSAKDEASSTQASSDPKTTFIPLSIEKSRKISI